MISDEGFVTECVELLRKRGKLPETESATIETTEIHSLIIRKPQVKTLRCEANKEKLASEDCVTLNHLKKANPEAL